MTHMDAASRADIRAAELIPFSPPKVQSDVYTPEQVEALFTAVHRGPANGLLVKQLFGSAEEIVAATSGKMPEGLTLDHFLAPMFHGYLAKNSAVLDPVVASAFYNPKLMDWARDYFNAGIVMPRQLHFNYGPPQPSADPGHFDATSYRGMDSTNTPIWLLSVMTNSRLFREYKIQLAAVVTWFWRASDRGGFTYWPDGGHNPPKRIPAPFWNIAVVAENENMYHRGETSGTPDQWGKVKGLTFDSVIEGTPGDLGQWQVRNGDTVIARLATEEIRWLFHWTAECYADYDAFRIRADHLDDLSVDRVMDIFASDLAKRDIAFTMPADPLNDAAFKALLMAEYAIGSPREYPAEAPVAGRMAA
ncbi:hypothetical protein J3E64_003427 [Sphingobium sp. OAS761]|uniref:hypothetical protein n=1 Tax=Sphingobium sp. OAS761 TaxID=2817901 RepID=UPI0020A0C329|nr:hypothetical protein [Sphingobium sp. OAS761]MCP1471714.1 hypothetical protein [Sphingobium sp. OAS761]